MPKLLCTAMSLAVTFLLNTNVKSIATTAYNDLHRQTPTNTDKYRTMPTWNYLCRQIPPYVDVEQSIPTWNELYRQIPHYADVEQTIPTNTALCRRGTTKRASTLDAYSFCKANYRLANEVAKDINELLKHHNPYKHCLGSCADLSVVNHAYCHNHNSHTYDTIPNQQSNTLVLLLER